MNPTKTLLILFISILLISTTFAQQEEVVVQDETNIQTPSTQPIKQAATPTQPEKKTLYQDFNDNFEETFPFPNIFSRYKSPIFRNRNQPIQKKMNPMGIWAPFHDIDREIFSVKEYFERQARKMENYWQNQFTEMEKYFDQVFPSLSSTNDKPSISNQEQEKPLTTKEETTNSLTTKTEPINLNVAIDIAETDKNYVIHAEIPGMSKKDLKIELDEQQSVGNNIYHIIKISGSRQSKFESNEGNPKIHRIETSYGKFERRLTLPTDVDVEDINKIQTSYNDGILTIELPKKQNLPVKEVKQPRLVPIN